MTDTEANTTALAGDATEKGLRLISYQYRPAGNRDRFTHTTVLLACRIMMLIARRCPAAPLRAPKTRCTSSDGGANASCEITGYTIILPDDTGLGSRQER